MQYKICIQVGKKIEKYRKKQKLSQEELAYRVGIHASTLGRIERGESNPPLHTLYKISKGLKVHIGDLFIFYR